jgi:hypothetical protein
MRQQLKRKDLVKRMFMIPTEIDKWLNEVHSKTGESRSLILTNILADVKKMQENLSKS